jgi:hypothetical protein
MPMRIGFRLSLLLTLIAGSMMADTIFSTFGPGDSFAPAPSSYDVGGGAFNSNIEDQQASSFVPMGSFFLDSIRVAAYFVEGSNQLTVYLASGPTEPGSPFESFSASDLSTTPTILTFDSSLHPLLEDGTRYWVVLTKADLAGGAEEWSVTTEDLFGRSNQLFQNGLWNSKPDNVAPAFDVSGTPVPESGSIVLLLTAIGALVVATRPWRTRYR